MDTRPCPLSLCGHSSHSPGPQGLQPPSSPLDHYVTNSSLPYLNVKLSLGFLSARISFSFFELRSAVLSGMSMWEGCLVGSVQVSPEWQLQETKSLCPFETPNPGARTEADKGNASGWSLSHRGIELPSTLLEHPSQQGQLWALLTFLYLATSGENGLHFAKYILHNHLLEAE